MRTVVFTKVQEGFSQGGDANFQFGRFQWMTSQRWDGGWVIEPIGNLLARMRHSGPYKHDMYRIVEAEQPELVIKPTCAGCGAPAGVDCQHTCAYLFGRVEVTKDLPITFNDDHQFSLSIRTATKGKNFGKAKAKLHWFNSVRCAELFLTECREVPVPDEPFGNGVRLLQYLAGDENKSPKRQRASRKAKATVWATFRTTAIPLESKA